MSKYLCAALIGAAISPAQPAFAQQFAEIIVTGKAAYAYAAPAGQTATGVDRAQFESMPALHVGDIVALQPGVTYAFGNGPRDVSISVRGSNARSTFGVRNVQVFEDGFPVTQPDGLARTDLVDPHAYAGIDIVHGPSSALYGNYATGGAILFRTRSGADLDGVEAGVDAGSDGYANVFVAAGGAGQAGDYSGFLSQVRGDGFTQHTGYRATTVNARGTLSLSPRDRVTVKLIDSQMRADLSVRLSLNQFQTNPFQAGCADLSAAGCGSVSVLANGLNGARVTLSADQAGLKRDDRRTIVGARWEHDVDAATAWRTQVVWDNRDINQPTSATSGVGVFESLNLMSDVTWRGDRTVLFAGAFANYEDIESYSYNLMPGGNAALGGLSTATLGSHLNTGLRARAEFTLGDRWSAVLGGGGEHTRLLATQSAYAYGAGGLATIARVHADRGFFNFAPEASLTFRPAEQWKFHARAAAAYGTPQATNLFVTPAGVPGNNVALEAQKMTGLDIGGEWAGGEIRAALTGFYEFFQDELVSQSAGANLLSYTFNAPRSEHRGIEASLDWRPQMLPGAYATGSYFLNDQIYKRYSERLSAGAFSTLFDRAGNKIPGAAPQTASVRLGYDAPTGFGGFVETSWREAAFVDNANLLKAPGYTLLNASLYYALSDRVRLTLTGQNLTDEIYVSSAGNVANSISAATGLQNGAAALAAATGSIYAGQPRTIAGGVKLRF